MEVKFPLLHYPFRWNHKSNRRRRKHIFEDIKPYMCLEGTCSDHDRYFPSLRTWIKHSQEHQLRTEYGHCPFRCGIKSQISSSMYWYRHVGHHLEELKLYILPPSLRFPDQEIGIEGVSRNLSENGENDKQMLNHDFQNVLRDRPDPPKGHGSSSSKVHDEPSNTLLFLC